MRLVSILLSLFVALHLVAAVLVHHMHPILTIMCSMFLSYDFHGACECMHAVI